MRIEAPGLLLVPYGVETWSPESLRPVVSQAPGLAFETSIACVLIDRSRRQPVRFNNTEYDLSATPGGIDEEDPFVAIREHTKRLCDPWNRFALDFLGGYFGAVERLIADAGDDIVASCGLEGGIFEPRDWIYSAPRPLPRAHLYAPAAVPSGSPHVVVDIAFWTGRRFVAVDGAIGQMLPKRAREMRERLSAAGIDLVTAAPSGPADWETFLARILEADSPRFWAGQPLPMGPFPSRALDALDLAEAA